MSVTPKTLIESKYAANAVNTEYTAPALTTTIIDKVTATNTDASTITLSVYLIPSGQSVAGNYEILKDYSLAASTAYDLSELKNHILSAGDFIAVVASAASKVVIRASGREVT